MSILNTILTIIPIKRLRTATLIVTVVILANLCLKGIDFAIEMQNVKINIITIAANILTTNDRFGLFSMRKKGVIRIITVKIYADPVYNEALNGDFVSRPSSDVARYSEAPMDKEALIPVIKPITAIRTVSWNARVNPANAPVNSTNASLKPSTMDPT